MSITQLLGLLMITIPILILLVWVTYSSIRAKDWGTLIFLGIVVWISIASILIVND